MQGSCRGNGTAQHTFQTGLIWLQHQVTGVRVAHRQTLTLQVAPGPFADGVNQLFQLRPVGRLDRLKARPGLRSVPAGKHAVEPCNCVVFTIREGL
jgi:hypothetical protein